MIPPGELDGFMAALAPGSLEVPDVVFAAAGCGAERAREVLATSAGGAGVTVSHDNCPHQSILCGPEAALDAVLERLRAERVLCQKLPFRSGFHSPSFAPYLDVPRRVVGAMPLQRPAIPLWSATTCAPYPDDISAVRDLV